MRSYGDYCPIAKGAEVLATRWTPIIVRNLLLGSRTFNEIRAGTHGIPRSVLTERLKLLEQSGVVERLPSPRGRGWSYELTEAGLELRPVLDALGVWGARWIETAPEDFDPYLVLWSMCRSIDPEQIPERVVVLRFDFRDQPKRRFWVLVQRPKPEVCVKHPGLDIDLVVSTETEWLGKWQMGRIPLGEAMRARLIVFDGPPRLVRAFAHWGGVGPFAEVEPRGGRGVATA
jgi:DNA-binding HxlR family transcriptional regulator